MTYGRSTCFLLCAVLLVSPSLSFLPPPRCPALRSSAAERPELCARVPRQVKPRGLPLAVPAAKALCTLQAETSDLYSQDTNLSSGAQEEVTRAGVDEGNRGLEFRLQSLRLQLLVSVAGLDRGASAGSAERKAVLTNVEALERESTLETFDGIGLDAADGLWRLVFSSALSAGSGSGGGASSQSLPIFQTPDAQLNSFGPGSQVGQVYARISSRKKKLENIVEVFLRTPLPFLPQIGKVVLNLSHKMEVVDTEKRRIKITLEEVSARNQGGPARQLRLPPLKIPVLEALSSQGAGVFDTTYCDGQIRITRGDRGEIRIFTKA